MIPSQERIIRLCKARNIPVSQLEKMLNLSNGYIRAARTREFPTDRLSAIAKVLNVSVDFLLFGEDDHRAKQDRDFLAAQLQFMDEQLGTKGRKIVTPADFKAAFFGNDPDLSEQDKETLWNDTVDFVEFRKSQLKSKRAESK